MHIYIRHGNDDKIGKYVHDLSLQSDYNDDIIKKTKKLIYKYGYPSKIYCSPFKRVRETVTIMLEYIKSKGRYVDIYIEPSLSRYFTSKEKKYPKVRKTTLKYDPPIYEDWDQFKKRVDKIEHKINSNNDIVWCITHYLVIKRITKNNNIDIPNYMPFLWHTIID